MAHTHIVHEVKRRPDPNQIRINKNNNMHNNKYGVQLAPGKPPKE